MEVDDFGFDFPGWDVGKIASGALLAAGAVEVFVGATVASGHGVREAALAAGAAQDAFEVVAVAPGLVPPRGVVRVQDLLHAGEQGVGDERFVVAVVLDVLVGEPSGVEAVAEHVVQPVEADGPFGLFAGGGLGEPAAVGFVFEGAECPVAGGVLLEEPHDVIGALGVGGDDSEFLAVHVLAGVAVAEGCAAGPAALFGFLVHAEEFNRLVSGFVAEAS